MISAKPMSHEIYGNALRLLTYVFAAVEYGSLRQAARKLGVGESSVSRNVVKLEQLLEMQLFDRDVRGVRLTQAGRAWTEVVRSHFEGLQEAFRDTARDNSDAKTVRIGLCAVGGGEFLKRLFDRFRKSCPDVSLAIEDVPREQCLTAIRRRRFDIVFASGLGTPTSCRAEMFWQERIFVLVPAGHPLAEKRAVTWADLAGMPLLVPVGTSGPLLDFPMLEGIVTDGCRPTVNICQAGQATVIFNVQLGQGITLAGESFAQTVAIDATAWKPLNGHNSLCPIKALWLETNPKRAVLRLIGLARKKANAIPSPEYSQSARFR
ncbi:LysR family transcriptional regulator [Mesorhizobium sp. M1C.F.Ca.ET.193.01.1.1]|nr:LysR family transcriptional regulator [Mesorhizobium sp. M1C.F.Ca.ET.210.01.1.1]TGQ65885.1 LysR family transcriptional regulator [Mesorhizobium sp. M1C.F.Ca.ET.212.01.1.1]TGQ99889.1 LysR family transcriptional regulator [Mesorhizobium sp. M1C.F.Ca.ET.204.01.1.1]TGR20423.1 LysR family transcriptional regulator [Mesorhizobium sp. M1C.F.Ca.ET.196.01.1.1]TGR43098.1 LysR family transcriptional regulator [Mesorhizobium sp. M1C.F.Ca.ET.195.01.1.1]TGR61681.1 LysR family transcriptional regulator [M